MTDKSGGITMNILSKFNKKLLLIAIAVSALFVHSCTEEIDTSSRYTFTGNTVLSYLQSHPESYSSYTQLLDIVPISDYSGSSVSQMLSARGNYTCFAPTNQAIDNYLQSLVEKGLISQPSWDAPEFQDEQLLATVRKTIVYNSIIDNGDDGEPYQTTYISDKASKEYNLDLANMKNNKLIARQVKDVEDVKYSIENCNISDINCDIYTINGYIHQVHSVIAPSDETVGDIFTKTIEDKIPGYYVFASIAQACHLIPELSKYEDEEYYRLRNTGRILDLKGRQVEMVGNPVPGAVPEHRYYGYTLFLEDDDWWANVLSSTLGGRSLYDLSPNEIVELVSDYVIEHKLYLQDDEYHVSTGDDYEKENNALNLFVTYHIVPAKIEQNKLVIHYNELYYSVKNREKRTIVFDYYTTMGKRRLIKTYEPPQVSGDGRRDVVFLNRFPELRNERNAERYNERRCDDDKKGVEILGVEKISNAYIYKINDCLYFNKSVSENMSNERIRIDVTTMLKEMMSNDIRCNESTTDKRKQCVGIPSSDIYRYFEDCEIGSKSLFYYLPGRLTTDGSYCWNNYQGDEINVQGNYELTFKLPPVPADGMYELRMGISANNQRGMCQVYFGEDKNRLQAAGIPLDLRMGGTAWYGGAGESTVGWVKDVDDDDLVNADNDKKIRNNGYMKAPNSHWAWTNKSFGQSGDEETQKDYHLRNRTDGRVLRRIILRQDLQAEKTYYIQFKSVLSSTTSEFFLDYIELCEKNVYDNPDKPEDIW